MPGKVLRRRQDTSLPSASYVRTAEPGHIRWRFTKSSSIDDGVLWIGIHIQNRREVEVNSYRARLPRSDPCELLYLFLFAYRPERHRGRKARASSLGKQSRQCITVVESHPGTSVLEVGGHEEGYVRPLLERIQFCCIRVWGPDRDHDPPDPPAINPLKSLEEFRIVLGSVRTGDPRKDKLPDCFT